MQPVTQEQKMLHRYSIFSWLVQFFISAVLILIIVTSAFWGAMGIIDFFDFTQKYNLFFFFIVYALSLAGLVFIGGKLSIKFNFKYFASATLVSGAVLIIWLTLLQISTLMSGYSEKYGLQTDLRNIQLNLRASAEVYYTQNNNSYEGFCQSDFVGSLQDKVDIVTERAQIFRSHEMKCSATDDSFAVELNYFAPMQDKYICVSSSNEPIAAQVSVFSRNGVCIGI
jgi:hypothetical protein